jgi:hypothetical protein
VIDIEDGEENWKRSDNMVRRSFENGEMCRTAQKL